MCLRVRARTVVKPERFRQSADAENSTSPKQRVPPVARKKNVVAATQMVAAASNGTTATGPWTPLENMLFSRGCVLHGWGNWRAIEHGIATRSRAQVKSHAQKFQQTHPVAKMRLQEEHERCGTRSTTWKAPKKKNKAGARKRQAEASPFDAVLKPKTAAARKKRAKAVKRVPQTKASAKASVESSIPNVGMANPPPISEDLRPAKAHVEPETRNGSEAGAPRKLAGAPQGGPPTKERKIPVHKSRKLNESRSATPPPTVQPTKVIASQSETLISIQKSCNANVSPIVKPNQAKASESEPVLPLGAEKLCAPAKEAPGHRPAADAKYFAGGVWSGAEQEQFKDSCVQHGWGNWTAVQRGVPTRSATQVKSHAQKFKAHRPAEKRRLQEEHAVRGTSPKRKATKKTKTGAKKRRGEFSPKKTKTGDAKKRGVELSPLDTTPKPKPPDVPKEAKVSKRVPQTKPVASSILTAGVADPVADLSTIFKSHQPNEASASKPEARTGLEVVARRNHVKVPRCGPHAKELKIPVHKPCSAPPPPIVKPSAAIAYEFDTFLSVEELRTPEKLLPRFSRSNISTPGVKPLGAPENDAPRKSPAAVATRTPSKDGLAAVRETPAPGMGPWSFTEQEQFKDGCILYGWGSWTAIERGIPTRSATQVKSHAQKLLAHRPEEKRQMEAEYRWRSDLIDKGAKMMLEGKAIMEKAKNLGKRRQLPAEDKKQHWLRYRRVDGEVSPGKTLADSNKRKLQHVLLGTGRTQAKKVKPCPSSAPELAGNNTNPSSPMLMTQGSANRTTVDDYGAAEAILALNNVARWEKDLDAGEMGDAEKCGAKNGSAAMSSMVKNEDDGRGHLPQMEARGKSRSEDFGSDKLMVATLTTTETASNVSDDAEISVDSEVDIGARFKSNNTLDVEPDEEDEQLTPKDTNGAVWNMNSKGRKSSNLSQDTSSRNDAPKLIHTHNRPDNTTNHSSQPPPHWLAADTWEECLNKIQLWNERLSTEEQKTEYLRYNRFTSGEKEQLRRKLVTLMNNRPPALPASG